MCTLLKNKNHTKMAIVKNTTPVIKEVEKVEMKVDKNIIINEVIRLRIESGFSTASIVKFIRAKYGYGNTYAYKLYNLASEQISETFNNMNNNAFRDSVMLMEGLLERAIAEDNGFLALSILKELNKCNQLYVQKIELEAKGEPIIINFK